MTTVNVTAPTLPSTPAQDCDPLLDSVAAKVIKTVAYSTLLLLSLVGNSVVPAVVYRNPELHTSINYIIASMSVSDVVFSIFMFPERIKQIYVVPEIWQIDGVLGSILCKSRAFVTDTSIIVTVLSLVIISVQRFCATVYPLKTQPLHSKKSCFIVIVFTWILAMLYSSQRFYTWRLETANGTTYCYESWEQASEIYERKASIIEYIVWQVCFIIIPFVVLTGLYCTIIISLQRKKTHGHIECNQRRRMEKKYRRVTFMLLTIVVVYLVPSIALNISVFLRHFAWTASQTCSNKSLIFSLDYLALTPQALNPYIYCIYIPTYTRGFRQMLCCRKDFVHCKYCKSEQEIPDQIPMSTDCNKGPGKKQNVAFVSMWTIQTE